MLSSEAKQIILSKLSKFDPSFVAIFGSYARNEQTPKSDLDILVTFRSKTNLLDLVGLEQELSESLNVPVDLVTQRSLSPYLKPFIEKDLIRIL